MPLLTESVRFHSGVAKRTIIDGQTGAPFGNFGAGIRTLKLFITNDGEKDMVVSIEGAEADAGYGLSWTSRANVTVKARTTNILAGAIRGKEVHWKVAAISSGGDSSGRLEITDASDNFTR